MFSDFGALVARMHRGDPDAIRQFIIAYGDPVRRAARRRILQLGLEKTVEPDHILDATIVELCHTPEEVGRIELDELWMYVDRAVQFEATAVWRHRNREFNRTSAAARIVDESRHGPPDTVRDNPPRRQSQPRFFPAALSRFRQILNVVLRLKS